MSSGGSDLLTEEASEAWQPTPTLIAEWLGGFRSAKAVVVTPISAKEPQKPTVVARPRPSTPIDWRLAAGMGVLGAVFGGGVATSWLPGMVCGTAALIAAYFGFRWWINLPTRVPVPRYHPRTKQRHYSVRADRHCFRARGQGRRVRLRWADVSDVLAWPDETVIRCGDEELRLPAAPAFEPFVRVVQRVVAERRKQEEAVLARMERGLSRPEFDEEADRGLSLSDADRPD